MSETILVAHGTKHGSTREVAEAVATTLVEQGFAVDLLPAACIDDVSPYHGVIVGGALYTGRWHPDALRLLKRHKVALATIPVAVFAVGPRTAEPHDLEEGRRQLGRALAKIPELVPRTVAVFGGVIDPRLLRFPFNRMPASDARDWTTIRLWALEILTAFGYGKAAPEALDPRSELQQTHR